MTPILDPFVSLQLCVELKEAGVTTDTAFRYRKYSLSHEETYLYCPAMDHLDLYRELDIEQPGYIEVPAYTLSDMIKVIPGVVIDRSEDGANYRAAAYSIYSLDMCMAFRVADAAALMVLQVIRKGINSAQAVSYFISL